MGLNVIWTLPAVAIDLNIIVDTYTIIVKKPFVDEKEPTNIIHLNCVYF